MEISRLNQEFTMIKPGDILNIGKSGIITSYLILTKNTERGSKGHSILTAKNISTGDIVEINKAILKKEIDSLESIGHRKVRNKVITSPTQSPGAILVPVKSVNAPMVASPVEAPVAPSKVAEKPSIADTVFANLEANIEKELAELIEINRLFESGNDSKAMDRLRAMN